MKFLVMLMVFTVTTGAFAVSKDCTSNDDNRDPNAVVKEGEAGGNTTPTNPTNIKKD